MKVRSLAKPVSFQERLEGALIGRPDEPRRRVEQDRGRVQLVNHSRQDLFEALDFAAANTQDSLALSHIEADRKLLLETDGTDFSGVSGQVATAAFDRDDRLKLYGRIGLGAALTGSLLAASGLSQFTGIVGLAAVGVGVGTAASTALMRQSQPHSETLSRLPIYAQLVEEKQAQQLQDAQNEQYIRDLAASLAVSEPSGLEMTEDGLFIGDVYLER